MDGTTVLAAVVAFLAGLVASMAPTPPWRWLRGRRTGSYQPGQITAIAQYRNLLQPGLWEYRRNGRELELVIDWHTENLILYVHEADGTHAETLICTGKEAQYGDQRVIINRFMGALPKKVSA